MKFGYGLLTCQKPPGAERSYETIYEDSIRLAQLAERHGFDAVWTSEHHFFSDGYSPSVLPLSAGIATATVRIDVGTSIALAPLYDPIRLAEDAATVDLLSRGRFRLGLANGYVQREFDAFDVPRSERGKRTSETIDICRRAWQSGSFTYEGDIFEYQDLRVEPTPSRDPGPPILLGGTSKPAVGRASRKADGHIGIVYYPDDFSYAGSFAQLEENAAYLDSQHDVGTDFSLTVMQYTHVEDDAEAAWDTLCPPLAYSRRTYAEHAENRDATEWAEHALTSDKRDTLRRGALVGDPETVIERLEEYERSLPGEIHFLARMWHPTLTFEQHREAIELFGTEVIPEFD